MCGAMVGSNLISPKQVKNNGLEHVWTRVVISYEHFTDDNACENNYRNYI